jgi:aldehyde dehydrogenase (NAD+)
MTVHAPIRHPDRLFIGGEWVKPTGTSKIDVINSGTEELYVSVAEAQEADVNKAVAAARKAFDEGPWPRMTHAERATYMRALADELEARADDMSRIWTTETGILHVHSTMISSSVGGVYRY